MNKLNFESCKREIDSIKLSQEEKNELIAMLSKADVNSNVVEFSDVKKQKFPYKKLIAVASLLVLLFTSVFLVNNSSKEEKYAKDNNISFIAIDNKYFATVEEPPKADVEIEPIPVPKISATKLSLKAGYSRTLKVTNGKVKEWRTSNKNVVKVASGKVTAIRKGTATVTAILTSGKKLYCKITVTTSPTLNRTSVILKPKQSYTLKITGKVGTAKFSTTNSKVAGVYQSGRILAKRKGAAYITVKTNGITLKCKVIVK